MAPFLSYSDFCVTGCNLEDRVDEIILLIDDFLKPKNADEYFIMDPYLNVDSYLRRPFEANRLDLHIWSNLIGYLSNDKSSFSIITNEETSLKRIPIEIPCPDDKIKVYACYFPNCKMYENYKLHDRYILKRSGKDIIGLHLGPSLGDIENKDVTITELDNIAAKKALDNFEVIWRECIRTKGWITN